MKVPTLYLDTSVIGGYFDAEWMADTREPPVPKVRLWARTLRAKPCFAAGWAAGSNVPDTSAPP